jgi:hypothetical protein
MFALDTASTVPASARMPSPGFPAWPADDDLALPPLIDLHRPSTTAADFAALSLKSPTAVQPATHARLMAELEAFLTPPTESVAVDQQPAVQEDTSQAPFLDLSAYMRLGIAQLCDGTESSVTAESVSSHRSAMSTPSIQPVASVGQGPTSNTPWPILPGPADLLQRNDHGKRDRDTDSQADAATSDSGITKRAR